MVNKAAVGHIFFEYFGFLAIHSTDCYKLVVYQTYQVDSVSPHPKKQEKRLDKPVQL
jgi:hypothetical protein